MTIQKKKHTEIFFIYKKGTNDCYRVYSNSLTFVTLEMTKHYEMLQILQTKSYF